MSIHKRELDARLTLMDSAQAFHWNEHNGCYSAICAGRPIALIEQGDVWRVEGDEEAARRYFDLDSCYEEICAGLEWLPQAAQAVRRLPGLRLLQQDVWEATLAFICSANNNTARIRTLVLQLCRDYGEHYFQDGLEFCGFPVPERLAQVPESELREKKFGYRAAYLIKTARMVAQGHPIADAARLPYDEAKRLLMALPGVGGKVADCVLLFGCGHKEAFPVDVWVERLLRCWCGIEEKNREKAALRAREKFGPNAGVIQQYLFHCARCGLISLEETEKTERE
ncbi:MAG: DNA glycosylase [Eubacteriales bacterium]|nr:DNA glycosylase [Eubacteriales bacterium]